MDSSSLGALANLLKPPKEDGDSEDEIDTRPSPYINPGAIGPTSSATPAGVAKAKTVSKDIWGSEEVVSPQQHDYDDPRPEPEYEMVFRQAVGAEDVFLGMGIKNPTTASCEDQVVRIKLPSTQAKDIDLDITESYLDCRTPQWRLGLHLPHKVDSNSSKAKWVCDTNTLQVTLKLNREFDLINH
ncbi:dynein axonemal assembly factor 6-like isoform X2 [Halichondria panicea]|uniref:dynein axonemal assembly factor 6-like isoform X2 n=1 Tax=Halichondria panicea TaxID=6063 RepID=UPI00312BC08F